MFLSTVFKSIGHFFESLFGKKQTQAFLKAAGDLLKSEIGKVALDAVKAAEVQFGDSNGAGAVKHSQVAGVIENYLVKTGKDISHSLINLLIELAVQQVAGIGAGATSTADEAPTA